MKHFFKAMTTHNLNALEKMLHASCAIKDDTGFKTGTQEVLKSLKSLVIPHFETIYPYLSYTIATWRDSADWIMKVKSDDGLIRSIYIMKQTSLQRIRLDIRYDGSSYKGFQRQKNTLSVQGELEKALHTLLKDNVTLHPASRTDASVHAFHQVVHFDTSMDLSMEKTTLLMNRLLPNDIQVMQAQQVPAVFHSRYDAVQKTYLYRISHQHDVFESTRVYHYKKIDLNTLNHHLESIVGTFDFKAFSKTPHKENTIRTITKAQANQGLYETVITIQGNGFLRHMVRRIIGQILYDIEHDVASLKKAFNQPNTSIKHLAEPQGLYLARIEY